MQQDIKHALRRHIAEDTKRLFVFPLKNEEGATSRSKLYLTFGPDVECRVKHAGAFINFFNDASGPKMERLRNRIHRSCGEMLYKKNPISNFHDYLEIRIKPSLPRTVLDRWERIQESAQDIAREEGVEFLPGAGHWHFRLNQLGGEWNPTCYSHQRVIDDSVIEGIVHCMRLAPALFVKPRLAEENNTKFSCLRAQDGKSSMGIYTNTRHGTHEIRCAPRYAELAVSLFMKGMLFGLNRELDKNECWQDFSIDMNGLADADGGPGTYSSLLDLTRKSGLAEHFYGPDLSSAIMRQMASDYIKYLAGDEAKKSCRNRAEHQDRLDRMEQISEGCSLPKPVNLLRSFDGLGKSYRQDMILYRPEKVYPGRFVPDGFWHL